MAKRLLLLLALIVSLNTLMAQTLSDDKVLEIIVEEQEKGSSQQEIASMLVKRGVTMEQLQRIKSKAKKVRFSKQDDYDQKNLSRERSSVLLADDKKELVDDEVVELMKNDSTDIADDTQTVFGRNIFKNENLTFEPSMNIPTPGKYILGAGDEVIIDVWGSTQLNVKQKISPDGVVFIDGAGPVNLAGLSIVEAEKYLKEVLNDVYGGSQISLSLGNIRSVQVQVMGEVLTPGTYTVSALSTAFNAIYTAGGISDIGTLREIKVFRAGKEIASIDVYEYILNGKTNGDVRLQDNDVINVGAYKGLVTLTGKVKRPMVYEIVDGETLLDVISYAGGFAGDAYTEKMNITRKSGREYSMHTVTKSDAAGFELKDGDVVRVDAMLQRYSNMIEIAGALFYPGMYELGNGISTVRELVEAAGGVTEQAFLNRAVLQHRNFDETIETQAIDLQGILNGTAPDVQLKNNDYLFVPNKAIMLGEQTVNIGGEVNIPGKYKFAENTTIEDLILQAGGLTRAASVMKIDVYRHKYDAKSTEYSDDNTEAFSFSLADGFNVSGAANFVLEPFDEVFVRRNPSYNNVEVAKIKGCVNFEGGYVIPNKNYRLSDLVKSAGGVTDYAYIKGASLHRKMTEEERKQREIVMQQSLIQMLEEDMRDDESEVNMAVLDSLMRLKLDLGEVYSVGIDLADAIKNPGSESDIVLRAGDELNIPEKTYTIRVSGEVNHPVALSWEKGKNIKYYIKHAGGYTKQARKRGVYIVYMNGNVLNASKNSKKVVEPGCEIVVPRSSSSSRLSPTEMATIGTSTASIATMIVAIINLLK